ncbi:glycoside hydrolase family 2 TIM barrel-domain containing protein [Nibricoccus sp. IMCC34717]|uniref:glycoside hydrolase family 2 TIM barrel-domain containing protein n=1 Tax=Nibricoccus sp. IMCC34717 TaxID=3034021 RepID=UPI00384CBABB
MRLPTPLAAFLFLFGLAVMPLTRAADTGSLPRIEIQKADAGFALLIDGKPFAIRGAVAPNRFDLLKACGANAVRTGARRESLDAAHAAGLRVMADLHLRGERDGMNWDDEALVRAQADKALATVRELKDHPAVLFWVLGNELDWIPPDVPYNQKIWQRLNALAAEVKRIDPAHPVLTVIGTSHMEAKVQELARDGTAFDLVGVNAYGDLAEATDILRRHWKRPYVVSEWGPTGHWEVPTTLWKAAIEQTSAEKARVTDERYRNVIAADHENCLGSFVFYWSEKQETTHTWYGLFCEGLRTQSIDVMEWNWRGARPANLAPVVTELELNGCTDKHGVVLHPGTQNTASLSATDADGDPLEYRWDIRPEVEIPSDNYAGNRETPTKPIDGLIADSKRSAIRFNAPAREGAYRLFVTVRDEKGSIGYANFPFFVSASGVYTPPAGTKEKVGFIPPVDVGNPATLGLGIQRTMTLLATSRPDKRNTVRILFYGQSITEQAWPQEVAADLRARFPHANLITANRALGGFSSQRLVKTAETDLYSFQPDLVVFHVYGGETEYRQIIERIRKRTTAEILIQTDHIGVKEAWRDEPTDPAAITKANWPSYMNTVFLPSVAREFGCGLVDQRVLWKRYLAQTKLDPSVLLSDDIHPNALGSHLIAAFANAALVHRADSPVIDPMNCGSVTTRLAGTDLRYTDGVLRLSFEGNRVDLVANSDVVGVAATVLIDGKRPSEHSGLYSFTRALARPGGKWPVIAPITSETQLVPEHWVMEVNRLDAEGKRFAFTLKGSVTGDDGEGTSDKRFRSKSGRVVIEPDSWDVAYALALPKVPIPERFVVEWDVAFQGTDLWQPELTQPGVERVTTVAAGLSNGPHTLEIRGGERALAAVRIYRPTSEAH